MNIALLAGLLSIAKANDIIFYEINTCNSGAFSGCFGVSQNVCCYTVTEGEAAAISISKGPLDFATMWSGGGCSVQQCSAGGSGTFCCVWNLVDLLTGGLFVTLSSKRDEPQPAVNCTERMEANVFGYLSDDGGAWQILADDVKDAFAGLHEEFIAITSENKTEWLQAHGAVYRAQLHDGPVTTSSAPDV